MRPIALLADIIEALEMPLDEMPSFLDLETGQVHTVSWDDIRYAEQTDHDQKDEANTVEGEAEGDDEEDEDEEDGEDEELALLTRIAFLDNVLRLPDRFEVNEWSIMEDFSLSVKNGRIREDLLRAIQGSGAFRYFRDTIDRYHIQRDWKRFRDDALRQMAIDWCEEHKVPWK